MTGSPRSSLRIVSGRKELAEELRLRMLKDVVARMLEKKLGKLAECGGLVSKIIASLLCDNNPKMKKEILVFLCSFCNEYGQSLGLYMKPVVGGLKETLGFKHGVIRAQTATVSN